MYKRGSGILFHIFSLPGEFGIGDLGKCAYSFVNKLADAKQLYWQILPLNPGISECGESPYFSLSAFAGNPLLIDLRNLVEEGFLDESDLDVNVSFAQDHIEYEKVRSVKLPKLEKAFQNFLNKGNSKQFDAFCEKHQDWLSDYALFLVATAKYKTADWALWPQQIRDRQPQALAQLSQEYETTIKMHCFYQYLFFRQWDRLRDYCKQKNITIIGDMPIYVSYESTDVWNCPQAFKLDDNKKPTGVSGVPPDYFSETGQLWNNPVYNWDYLHSTNYEWWVRRMKAMLMRFDIVRIDHFRGLVQYWEVPAGEKTAMNGEWKDVPTYTFFDKLQQQCTPFSVIAEDLGTITPDVREAMNHYGYPGMKVLQFAFGDDNPMHPYLPHTYSPNFFVYTGTHDNNTTIGWFDELSVEEKQRVFNYIGKTVDSEECVWELIRLAFQSVADVAIIPFQDVVGLSGRARINNPATIQGNWNWKATQEELDTFPVQKLALMSSVYGRCEEKKTI